MVDSEKKVWLIEANTNPCLEESNSYMSRLVPRMINDTLELTLDDVFSFGRLNNPKKPLTKDNETNQYKYHLEGYKDCKNLWHYLGNML